MACGKCGAKRAHMPGCSDEGKATVTPKYGAAVKRGEQIPRERNKNSRDPCPPHNPTKCGELKNGNTKYQCSRCKQYLGDW